MPFLARKLFRLGSEGVKGADVYTSSLSRVAEEDGSNPTRSDPSALTVPTAARHSRLPHDTAETDGLSQGEGRRFRS